MSLSLTQKLADDVGIWKRLIIAFANSDEIFAVAMGYFKEVTFPYMLGLQILPILGWGGGTFAGAVASGLLPKSVCSALSLALYGMFVPRSQNLCYLWYAWQLCSVSFYIMFRYSTLSRPEYRSLYVQ